MLKLLARAGFVASSVLVIASPALASGSITNGLFTVGIGSNGELAAIGGVGFLRESDGYDPFNQSNARDSWGLRTAQGVAIADQNFYGTFGITGTSFDGLGGSTATALTTTSIGVTVEQKYRFAAPNILQILHTVTNTTGGDLAFSFQRNWDVDISPTVFDENTFWPTDNVAPPQLIDSTFFGFEDPDPAVAYESHCLDPSCNVREDVGGGIKIALGLGGGQSARFSYWYGINKQFYSSGQGQSVDSLIGQARSLGISYLIATQSAENGLHPSLGGNSAFIGISAIPEPMTWTMLILGFGFIGIALRLKPNQSISEELQRL